MTEAGIANGMTFVIFYILACISKLAFCSVKKETWEKESWEAYNNNKKKRRE
jgi:hypothetical protein